MLIVTERAAEKIDQMVTQISNRENSEELWEKFEQQLKYLHHYGGDRGRVTLYGDSSLWSFGFNIEFRRDYTKYCPHCHGQVDEEPVYGEYSHFMCGGLIFHRASKSWSCHT